MSSFNRWSAYGSIGRSMRISFLATNLLSFLMLLAVFVYGCWLYHNKAKYAELLAPALYVDVSRIMIIVSIIAIINAIIAVYSVMKELRSFIYAFATASFILFVMLLIGGIMGFVFRDKLINKIPLDVKMLTTLKELYSLPDNKEITNAWDDLQKNFQCCGVAELDNYTVWKQSKWHMHLKDEPKPSIPLSCCKPGKEEDCVKLVDGTYYEQTCYMLLKTDLLTVMNIASWLLVVSSITLLLPAFFSTIYARLIKK